MKGILIVGLVWLVSLGAISFFMNVLVITGTSMVFLGCSLVLLPIMVTGAVAAKMTPEKEKK